VCVGWSDCEKKRFFNSSPRKIVWRYDVLRVGGIHVMTFTCPSGRTWSCICLSRAESVSKEEVTTHNKEL
jgi:hypothetical protein